jgi:hypothetical protein
VRSLPSDVTPIETVSDLHIFPIILCSLISGSGLQRPGTPLSCCTVHCAGCIQLPVIIFMALGSLSIAFYVNTSYVKELVRARGPSSTRVRRRARWESHTCVAHVEVRKRI